MPRRALFDRLASAARVTEVSAPAGYGKTWLLRSWISEAGLADRAAWVSVQTAESNGQRFWLSALEALRVTAVGRLLVRGVSAAPDLDGWVLVERLLEDLGSLEHPLWLVIDDLHQLRSEEAMHQLELLVMRAPAELRFVIVTRYDLSIGLHRLRLEGGLSEIRARHLRFSLDESRALFTAAGVQLSDEALTRLHERTEGWPAGLRLAALSLTRHADPERFTSEFSGSERTVAEYLLAEVLERQPEEVRRLLLRTSILERVSGPLADVLTGDQGGERILQELEEASAFVVSLDEQRSWFRYHHLFADLLTLELGRSTPDDVPTLHRAAAEWFAEHGYPIEAVRHAQTAQDWTLAAGLLSDHWLALYLDGQATTARELLGAFPASATARDPELTALTAADNLAMAELQEAERYLSASTLQSDSIPQQRRARFEVTLAVLRLQLARQRGDLPAVMEGAKRLLAVADAPGAVQVELGEELRALALIGLGVAEMWTSRTGGIARLQDADRHLDQGVALAHRVKRPYLELTGLAHRTVVVVQSSYTLAANLSMQAIEIAEGHGWSEEPIAGIAYMILGGTLVGQGRLEEAARWLRRAGRALRAEVEPSATVVLHDFRGILELASGRYEQALESFRTTERLARRLVTAPEEVLDVVQPYVLETLVKMGEAKQAAEALAELGEEVRPTGHLAVGVAVLRLAQDDQHAAVAALAPILDGSVPVAHPLWKVEALLLDAVARDALGDAAAAARSLERALELAAPESILLPFLLHPAPRLLAYHRRHRANHGALVSAILNLQADPEPASPLREPEHLREPLTERELRVLRYLPTNLSLREIADELGVSVSTIKTHIEHLYAKLDVHRRREAVERARALGLIASAPHGAETSPTPE